jgi:glycosyltransferase involved in cell wall biosynthesis
MTAPVPTVTVVIAARPGSGEPEALEASRRLDYPADRVEILVARGSQPSAQRNAAVRAARGEWIYFLDDDSIPAPGNLVQAQTHIGRETVQAVGGPNLCPPDAPALEQAFAATMGNALAFGPSCARYRKVGELRATSEKELILCNLLMRRQTFLDLGGFNEALYPNEENALMDLIQARGGVLIYDPNLVVRRRPRGTLGAFLRMLMTYGRGRAEQVREHPTWGSAPNFAPPLFVVFAAGTPLWPRWWLWAWAFYAAAVAAALLRSPRPAGASGAAVGALIVATHVCYGLGFWRGLFTPLHRPAPERPIPVTLENHPRT